ncbi:MAG: hypothetical protein ACRDIY_12690 [Chloroflexota bacterium]
MTAKIRVGIVGPTVTPGGSGWGANAHVPALNALSAFQLKAVCTAHAVTRHTLIDAIERSSTEGRAVRCDFTGHPPSPTSDNKSTRR